jgi:ATP synthase protein I
MNDEKNKRREFFAVTRLTSVGIALVVSTMIGWGIGIWLDRHLHTAPVLTMIFLVLGMGSGIINIFRTLGKHDR